MKSRRGALLGTSTADVCADDLGDVPLKEVVRGSNLDNLTASTGSRD